MFRGLERPLLNSPRLSLIGRFLEHSRVFYFANGGDAEIYIGSADWMSRNLKHRIEVVAPVSDPALKHYLKNVLLEAYLRDNVKARELKPDGLYAAVSRAADEKPFARQTFFINHVKPNCSLVAGLSGHPCESTGESAR